MRLKTVFLEILNRLNLFTKGQAVELGLKAYDEGHRVGLEEGTKIQSKVLADFAQEKLDQLVGKKKDEPEKIL